MIISVSGRIGTGKDTVGAIIQYLTNKELHDVKIEHYLSLCEICINNSNNWKIVKFADKLKDMVCILLGYTRKQLEDREFKEKELSEEWWYFKGRHGTLIPYNKDSKRSDEDLIKLTPRLILQLLGTECGRQIIHPNIWINATMTEYKCLICNHQIPFEQGIAHVEFDTCKEPNWIITDTRFPNELQAIKDRGGISIRIDRLIEKNVYVIENEQPFQNWFGVVKSYNGNNFYNVINNNEDVILVHKNQITLSNEHFSETALDNAEFDYVIDNNGTIEDLIIKVKEILIKENIL